MTSKLIVEIDDALARNLEAVAPARARKRSEFIRRALRTALDQASEARMRQAYAEQPDDEPTYFDPAAWEASEAPPKAERRKHR